MRPISFQLTGGVGNQMFSLCAGKYIEAEFSRPVDFFFEKVKGDRIDEVLNLESIFGPLEMSKGPAGIARGLHKIVEQIPGNLSSKSSIYDSPVVGFDENLESAVGKRFVRGYFQSHLYVDSVLPSPVDLHRFLIRPSDWYQDFWEGMNQVNYGSVHLRRGDYANLKHSIGLLGTTYYSNLFRNQELSSSVDVWLVFSDEPGAARDLIQNHMPSNSILVEPPPSSKPIESMAIMSNSQALAIANSTFSWWSAYLGKQKRVIAPSPWFRNLSEPSQLVPKKWKLAAATWED